MLKKMLLNAGCRFERQGKGDHEIWYSPITERNFVVDSAIKSRHTANAVLKQAGLPKAFWVTETMTVGIMSDSDFLPYTSTIILYGV